MVLAWWLLLAGGCRSFEIGAEPDATAAGDGGPEVLARDDFERTLSAGWGTAEIGGDWSLVGEETATYSVGGGGQIELPMPTAGAYALLESVSTSAVDCTVTIATDKLPEGGSIYVTLIGRRVSPGQSYDLKIVSTVSGAVRLSLGRRDEAEEISFEDVEVPVTHELGEPFHLRFQVIGADPTVLRGKLWRGEEPDAWTITNADETPALQAAGAIGFFAYLSSSATNAPVTVTFDDVLALPAD